MRWEQKLNKYISIISKELEKHLDITYAKNDKLIKAMKYSIMAGGKRLRPILAIASYEIFDTNIEKVLPYACAIEMIHTYSLIHDDLPAMDDDVYRRGKLTNHIVFGEGVAILAGDGLLNYAFEIMINETLKHKNMRPYIDSMNVIAKASGINGMIGGQVVDIESNNQDMDAETLDYIHLNKTAALIIAPLKVGAIIAGADENQINDMEHIGRSLGLAFQIRDDILDIIGDKSKLGKDIGSDEDQSKFTYPSLYGMEKSINKVKDLTYQAQKRLEPYGEKAKFLYELTEYLIGREI